jgi:hypothetical protein
LGFNDNLHQVVYNQVDSLKREILEVKTIQNSLRVELFAVKEKAWSSWAQLKALMNSF